MTTTSPDDRRVPIRTRVEHLPLAERVARGRDARAEVPQASHAELPLGSERPAPIALLEGQAESRVPEIGDVVLADFPEQGGEVEATVARDIDRADSTVRVTLRVGDTTTSSRSGRSARWSQSCALLGSPIN